MNPNVNKVRNYTSLFSFDFSPNCINVTRFSSIQQQYRVVPFLIGWVRAGFGLGLTGKLDRAWVGAWMVVVVCGGCTTWIGDVGLGGWELSCW